jgi:N-acetylneuraminic acid mutarotase
MHIEEVLQNTAARSGATISSIGDGHALMVGGISGKRALKSLEVYSLGAKAFSAHKASLQTPRAFHTATTLADGRILFVGGVKDDNMYTFAEVNLTAEIYDPKSDQLTVISGPRSGRFGHTATLLSDGRVLIVGGGSGSEVLHSAELFDPELNQFIPVRNTLQEARTGHQAVVLLDGRVLIMGGFGKDKQALSSIEYFDPSAERFSSYFEKLKEPRANFAAAITKTGEVLIFGGTNKQVVSDGLDEYPDHGYLSSVEIIEPTQGGVILFDKHLAMPRSHAIAVESQSGGFLLFGGMYAQAMSRVEQVSVSDIKRLQSQVKK